MRLLTFLCLVQTLNVGQSQDTIIPIENLQGSVEYKVDEFFKRQNVDIRNDPTVVVTIKEMCSSDNWELFDKSKEPKWNIEQNNFYTSGQSASSFGTG